MTEPRNILVTGASRGIGAAIVEAFAGHRVAGHSSAGGDGRIAADLALPGAAEALWAEALGRLDGRIDVLVNNAGIFEAAPISLPHDEWVAEWERTQRVNLTASAELCRLAVRHFQDRGGGGRIVNVASRAAYRGDSPDHWHYAASKAGIIGFSKSLALELAPHGITVNVICPGITDTAQPRGHQTEEQIYAQGQRIPLGRIGQPEDLAGPAVFLASDAARFITGQTIFTNGGGIMW